MNERETAAAMLFESRKNGTKGVSTGDTRIMAEQSFLPLQRV